MKELIKKRENYIAILIILAAMAVNLWHMPKGFSSRDSSFWVGTVYRFAMGDIPIIHEWHPAQMGTILLVPFMKLFLTFNGSTDGMIMFCRFLYVFCLNLPVSLFIYHKFNKHGKILTASLCAAVLLFTMGGEMIPNYNTMGLSFCLLFAILFAITSDHFKRDIYLSGLFYAALVLCCPYMALFYFFFSILALLSLIFKNNEFLNYSGKRWLYFTLGSATLAALVIIWLLSKASVSDYLRLFPEMFNDPEHPTNSLFLLQHTVKMLKAVWRSTKMTIILVPLYALSWVFAVILKKKKKSPKPALYIFSSLTILLIFGYRDSIHNFAMIVFVPIGLLTMLMDKDHNKELRSMFILGIVYIFMINLASDTALNASSMASITCMIPSAIMYYEYLCKSSENMEIQTSDIAKLKTLFAVTMAVLIGFEVFDRIARIYEDSPPYTLNTKITEGPLKGTYTTSDKAETYSLHLKEIKEFLSDDSQTLFVLNDNGWPYLCSDDTVASYSIWLKGNREFDIYRLKDYYEYFPDHIPDHILIVDGSLEYKDLAINVISSVKPDVEIMSLTED